MNYTKAALDLLPDLSGSAENAKLKVDLPETRVWLLRNYSVTGDRYEVLVEKFHNSAGWLPMKRYPA